MRALDSQTLSTTATCFQCDGDGRRTGLKIRSSQEGVGSSPNFGVDDSSRIASPRIAGGAELDLARCSVGANVGTYTARECQSSGLSVIRMPLRMAPCRPKANWAGRTGRLI